MAEHTPTPWELDDDQASIVARGGEDWIADCNQLNGLSHEECEANAAFICKAVNNHEALVTALKGALSELSYLSGRHGYVSTETAIIRVKQALDGVGGTPK